MNPTLAMHTAMTLSFLLCVLAAIWYVIPWLRSSPRETGVAALLWVHAFRHIALQIFSAQQAGFAIPDGLRDQIVYGDVLGMLLAVGSIAAWRGSSPFAVPLTWVFVVATVADLINALVGGMREGMLGIAEGVTWMILAFYVPMLWVSLLLIVWLLLRGNEPREVAAS